MSGATTGISSNIQQKIQGGGFSVISQASQSSNFKQQLNQTQQNIPSPNTLITITQHQSNPNQTQNSDSNQNKNLQNPTIINNQKQIQFQKNVQSIQGQNRISKQNLRENNNNFKDYGMSIITGGTKPSSSGGIGVNSAASSQNNKTPLRAHQIKANQIYQGDINQQYQIIENGNNLKDLIEVKTSGKNYKMGKSTINQRIGEDFEPDKPIINYNQVNNNLNQQKQEKISSPIKQNQERRNSFSDGRDQVNTNMNNSLQPNSQLLHSSHKFIYLQLVNGDKSQIQGNQLFGSVGVRQNQNNNMKSPEKQIVLDNYSAVLQQNSNLQSLEQQQINQNLSISRENYKKRPRGGQSVGPSQAILPNQLKNQSQLNQYQSQFQNQQSYEISGPIEQNIPQINQNNLNAIISQRHIQQNEQQQRVGNAQINNNQNYQNEANDENEEINANEQSQKVQKQQDGIHANHLMNRDKQAIIRRSQIVVNTSHCRCELDTIQYVIGKNGYRETNQPGDGTILWYGMALRDHDLDIIKMRKCIFNRYPLMDHFAKKNIFCVIISRLQRFFPIDYKFMPDSFLLPDEVRDFEHHLRQYPGQTFIAKPSKGRGGDGIILLKKFTDLPKAAFHNEYLVQRYVDNPLIIDKKKFDCRVYVLIRGVDPVEAYLCDEGLARFCTHNYKKPDQNNIKDHYMHLTNFSLNKNSQRFKAPGEQFLNDDKSSKQLFTTVIKNLMNRGKDTRNLLKQVREISQKTVIALEPYLKNAYHCFISTNHQNPRSFQILGLDILIDENLNGWLLEVNANPSLNVYSDKELPNGDIEQTLSELDKYVKTMVVSDTIKIVTTPNDQIKNIQEMGCLKKILPMQGAQLDELYLYTYAEKMFEILAGQKSYDFITSTQFQRLSKYQGLTNNHIMKAHYDIIYKNVVRRSDNNQMDLNCFFEALEELANRLFNHQDPFENLQEVIEIIKKHVSLSN